jgi:CRP/FNR family transcriptional regulator
MQPQRQTFLDKYRTKKYQKGEIILFQGEAPRQAYVAKSGIIKSYNLSAAGDEKPVGFSRLGESFPTSWIFAKTPSALFYYEAFTDVEVYLVPRDDYVAFLKNNPTMLFDEFNYFVEDHLGKSMRLNALQHSRASDKLIYTLHYLTLTHGLKKQDGVTEISLALTHQDFANLTGLTRETTATELNKLKKAGVIAYGKHTNYKVDVQRLNHVLNDQFIADLKLSL